MVAAREQSPKLTPEEYFAWEELQEVKLQCWRCGRARKYQPDISGRTSLSRD